MRWFDLDARDADGTDAEAHASLSDEERERAGRLASAQLRDRYVAAHVALRSLLGEALNTAPVSIGYAPRPCTRCGGPHGKPALPATGDPLGFNLSHAGRLGAVAFGRELEVGIDIETTRRAGDMERLAGAYLTGDEARAIASLPHADQPAARLAQWVRKEALLKATGEGLNTDPRAIALPVAAPAGGAVRRLARAGAEWAIIDLALPGAVAAVAAAPRPRRVRVDELRRPRRPEGSRR